MKGFEIRLAENGNILKKQVLSLFILKAIADSEAFSVTVSKLAPANHPLRSISSNTP